MDDLARAFDILIKTRKQIQEEDLNIIQVIAAIKLLLKIEIYEAQSKVEIPLFEKIEETTDEIVDLHFEKYIT